MFTLRLREASTIPIDMTGILPETLEGLTLLEAAKKPVRCGNRQEELGALFEIEPLQAKSLQLRIDTLNDASLTHLGESMSRGTLHVLGRVGMHAGARMTGGVMTILGAAEDWLGAEMSGGFIGAGSAGSQVGGAYRGSRRGMSGGQIAIYGNAGDEVGLRMRRGSITILGNTGSFAGAAMIAGTIRLQGTVGEHLGAGMKRGTIIVKEAPKESLHFRFSCNYEPQYLHLLNKEFRDVGKVLDVQSMRSVRLYRGDLLTGGRGELWHITT